jgi:hypothetical protein
MAATVATAAISTRQLTCDPSDQGTGSHAGGRPSGRQRPRGSASAPQLVNGDLGAAGALLTALRRAGATGRF